MRITQNFSTLAAHVRGGDPSEGHRKQLSARAGLDWAAIVLFGLGALRFFEFQSIGTLYGTDFAVLACLPFAIARANRLRHHPETLLLLGLIALWFANAVLSDVIRGTPPSDFLRGWAKVGLLGLTLFVVMVISGYRLTRLTAFLCGLAVATIVGVAIHPTAYQEGQPWKFGLGMGLGIIAATLAGFVSNRRLTAVLVRLVPMAIIAGVCLANNARNMFGTIALAVLATLVADIFGRELRKFRASVAVWCLLTVLGAVAAYGVVEIYSVLAERGALGAEAQAKYQAQAATGSLVVGGRGELLVATRAIMASPLIGHGSWAQDVEYKIMLVSLLRERGVNAVFDVRTGTTIPAHSYLTQSWVEHGIFGGIFWTCALVLTTRAMMHALRIDSQASPVFFVAAFLLLWAVPFSPYGAENRFFAAAQLGMVLCVLDESRRSRTSPSSLLAGSRGRASVPA